MPNVCGEFAPCPILFVKRVPATTSLPEPCHSSIIIISWHALWLSSETLYAPTPTYDLFVVFHEIMCIVVVELLVCFLWSDMAESEGCQSVHTLKVVSE